MKQETSSRNHPEFGLVTVATRPFYRKEVQNLIHSINEYSPSLELTVFTDESFLDGSIQGVKESIIASPTHTFFDKVTALQHRPYRKTLYVDTDTCFARDVKPVFELLNGCDVAAVHDSWRVEYRGAPPEAFPEPNLGVLLLGDSPQVDLMIDRWAENYHRLEKVWSEGGSYGDQHPLWEVLWKMQCDKEIRFLALPTEWNIHIWHPISLAQNARPAIIHGRNRNLAQVGVQLSSSRLARAWIPNSIGWNSEALESGVIFGGRLGNLAIKFLRFLTQTFRAFWRSFRPLRKIIRRFSR